jgi:hypothetical protein
MAYRKPWLIVLLAFSTFSLSFAQGSEREEEDTGGFWPTRLMLMRALDRAVDDMSGHYDLDDDQAAHIADVLKERLPEWMNKNRKEITALMNQYIEALLDGEPPDPETVAEWSKRVQPLISGFQELVEDMSGEFSTVMTDDQRVQLEGELAAFNTGLSFVQKKIAVWADGGYDPETEWPRNNSRFNEARRQERREMRNAMNQAREQASTEARTAYGVEEPQVEPAPAVANKTAESADAPARSGNQTRTTANRTKPAPRDEWEVYVELFIRKYELREDQAAKAQQYLRTAQEERDNLLRRKSDELAKIEKRIREATTREDREKAQSDLEKAKAPIERIFTRMENKLFGIPTTKQKNKVRDAEAKGKPGQENTRGEAKPDTPGANPEDSVDKQD